MPLWPDMPKIEGNVCGEDICFTVDEVKALAGWIGEADRWHTMAELCLARDSFHDTVPFQDSAPVFGFDVTDNVKATAEEAGIGRLIKIMTLRGMSVTWKWETCGEVNGYYTILSKHITLCYELLKEGPEFARFVAAHEMAHAVIWQTGIPYTGSGEVAADELAAVVLLLLDHDPDILAGANYFKRLSRPENPYGEHPGDLRRWITLVRLTEDGWWQERALTSWALLLSGKR